MKKTSILLTEDNRPLRDGIKAIINKQADLRVVAATAGNHDTLLQARTLKPQVVLMDLGLRSDNGVRIVTTPSKENAANTSQRDVAYPFEDEEV